MARSTIPNELAGTVVADYEYQVNATPDVNHFSGFTGYSHSGSGAPVYDEHGATTAVPSGWGYPTFSPQAGGYTLGPPQVIPNPWVGTVVGDHAYRVFFTYDDSGESISYPEGDVRNLVYGDSPDGTGSLVALDGSPYTGATGGNDPYGSGETPVDTGGGSGGSGGAGGGTGGGDPLDLELVLAAGVEFYDPSDLTTPILSLWGDSPVYATNADFGITFPGFKGDDTSLDGQTGSIYVQKLHGTSSYKVSVEWEGDDLADFYANLDHLAAAVGSRRLAIKVTRATGEVRWADDAYLSASTDATVVEAHTLGSVQLTFTLPYPYWRGPDKLTGQVVNGTVPAFAGITAPIEDAVLVASGAGTLSSPDGSSVTVPSGCTIDCAAWTSTIDIRTVVWPDDQALIFALLPTWRVARTSAGLGPVSDVPRAVASGGWTITAYPRFLTC